jgi:hypothetical protein
VNAFFFAAFASFDANVAMDGAWVAGSQPSNFAYGVSAALTVAILLLAVISLIERALRRRFRRRNKKAGNALLRTRQIRAEAPLR